MGDCCDLPECLDELSNYSLENGLNTRLPPAPGFSADSCTPSLHLCTPNTCVCGISPSQGWTLAFSSPRMNLASPGRRLPPPARPWAISGRGHMCHHHSLVARTEAYLTGFKSRRTDHKDRGLSHAPGQRVEPHISADGQLKSPDSPHPLASHFHCAPALLPMCHRPHAPELSPLVACPCIWMRPSSSSTQHCLNSKFQQKHNLIGCLGLVD